MNRIIGVCITDMDLEDCYNAYCEKDCRDCIDLQVYKNVLSFEDVIQQGHILGQPIWEKQP